MELLPLNKGGNLRGARSHGAFWLKAAEGLLEPIPQLLALRNFEPTTSLNSSSSTMVDPSKENDLEMHLAFYSVPLEVRERIKALGFTTTYDWPWAVPGEEDLRRMTQTTPFSRVEEDPEHPQDALGARPRGLHVPLWPRVAPPAPLVPRHAASALPWPRVLGPRSRSGCVPHRNAHSPLPLGGRPPRPPPKRSGQAPVPPPRDHPPQTLIGGRGV